MVEDVHMARRVAVVMETVGEVSGGGELAEAAMPTVGAGNCSGFGEGEGETGMVVASKHAEVVVLAMEAVEALYKGEGMVVAENEVGEVKSGQEVVVGRRRCILVVEVENVVEEVANLEAEVNYSNRGLVEEKMLGAEVVVSVRNKAE